MRPTRLSSILLLGALALLGACARDATAPKAAPAAPRAATAATAGDYLVAFRANAVPADFGARVAALRGTVTYSHGGAGLAAVSGLDAAGAATLAAAPDVSEVQPDVQVALDDQAAPAAAAADVTIASQADPTKAWGYAKQWDMRAILAPTAWAAGRLGSAGVTVAILDTGLDYDAFDLAGLVDLSRSRSFVPDDTAYAKLFPGLGTRNPITDYDGHGTNVATQVASKGLLFAGVTSKTKLIGVKVLSAKGSGSFGGILLGVLWAADQGADVANMSLGGAFLKAGANGYGGFINRVFNYAARQGMLIVVAAGNSGADLDHVGPVDVTFCSQPQVLCVSATGPRTSTGSVDAFSYYSNYGRSAISVAAPGGNASKTFASWVYSSLSKTTVKFDTLGTPSSAGYESGYWYTGYMGTSQATPHVAGLAALLVAETGRGQPAQIRNLIMQSADDLGQPGVDPFYGRGRINVARALGF